MGILEHSTYFKSWSIYKNWKWAEFFPRMWLINMMKVLRASRKISALSSLDGARKGSLRPAKQIFPLGKICAISFPLLSVLRFPRDRRILAKIPKSMFHSDWDTWTSLVGQVKVWIEMGRRPLDRLSMSWCVNSSLADPEDAKREEVKSQTTILPTTISDQNSDEEWRFREDAASFYTCSSRRQEGRLVLFSLWPFVVSSGAGYSSERLFLTAISFRLDFWGNPPTVSGFKILCGTQNSKNLDIRIPAFKQS